MSACYFGCRGNRDKIGVLIAQLGTPDAPTEGALRPYLKQFLGDPRVIEKNRALWWVILNVIILRTRPKRSAELYKRIWTDRGSPLLAITEDQTKAVRERFAAISEDVVVAFGMRYGNPSLESAIDYLIDEGCSKILLFPMYPQYSATTTAATYDVVFSHLIKRRFVPTLRVAEPYYLHQGYIKALAATINEALAKMETKPSHIVLSYHGIPESYVGKGDPYCCMCTETTRALLPELSFPASNVIHTFQSRFGRDPWLEPYTDETIERLAKEGVTNIALACPGFPTDCLETLDELGNEGRELFEEHGGKGYDLIPCLNTHPAWVDAMTEIIQEELGSWLQKSERCIVSDTPVECPVQLVKLGRKQA